MSSATELNTILAEVWSLVRLLRKLEHVTVHPGTSEALKRVRRDVSAHCATLSGIVRALGEGPVDRPSATAAQLGAATDESALWSLWERTIPELTARLDAARAALTDDAQRSALAAIAGNLGENRLWLDRLRPR